MTGFNANTLHAEIQGYLCWMSQNHKCPLLKCFLGVLVNFCPFSYTQGCILDVLPAMFFFFFSHAEDLMSCFLHWSIFSAPIWLSADTDTLPNKVSVSAQYSTVWVLKKLVCKMLFIKTKSSVCLFTQWLQLIKGKYQQLKVRELKCLSESNFVSNPVCVNEERMIKHRTIYFVEQTW